MKCLVTLIIAFTFIKPIQSSDIVPIIGILETDPSRLFKLASSKAIAANISYSVIPFEKFTQSTNLHTQIGGQTHSFETIKSESKKAIDLYRECVPAESHAITSENLLGYIVHAVVNARDEIDS